MPKSQDKGAVDIAAMFNKPKETINHPDHYGGADNPYEAIKVIEAWGLGFCLGNAVKYIIRSGHKGSEKEDLQKAIWYVKRAHQNNEINRPEWQGGDYDPMAVSTHWELDGPLHTAMALIYNCNYEKAADHIQLVVDKL